MRARFLLLPAFVMVSAVAPAACTDDSSQKPSGGTFTAPDSSFTADAGPPVDAAAPDAADAGDACPPVVALAVDASVPSTEADAGNLPGPPATVCSASGTEPGTTIHWVNDACVPVEAWWVDFACQEVYYQDVPALGTFAQATFVGHTWRLREKGTHVLLREVPANPDANPTTYTFP